MLQSMAAADARVFEFLNEPEEAQLADPARRADPADIDGQDVYKRQAQMDALRGALMDAILAENAARNIDPKGETNHDKDL